MLTLLFVPPPTLGRAIAVASRADPVRLATRPRLVALSASLQPNAIADRRGSIAVASIGAPVRVVSRGVTP